MNSEQITQLEKLAELHAKGVLSVDEFQAQKSKILSGPSLAASDSPSTNRMVGLCPSRPCKKCGYESHPATLKCPKCGVKLRSSTGQKVCGVLCLIAGLGWASIDGIVGMRNSGAKEAASSKSVAVGNPSSAQNEAARVSEKPATNVADGGQQGAGSMAPTNGNDDGAMQEDLPQGWQTIGIGQQRGDLSFLKDGGIAFRGQRMQRLSVAQGEKIYRSPASPDGRYTFIIDQNDQDSRAYLLDLVEGKGASLNLGGPPTLEVSWSPDSKYAFLSSYNEGNSALWLIDFGAGMSTQIQQLPTSETETYVARFETFKWNNGRVSWITDAFCNPYAEGSRCPDGADERPSKSYQVEAEASSGDVVSRTPLSAG